MDVSRRGTDDRPLGPGGAVPFPSLTVGTAAVETPEDDGHAAGCVASHRVQIPWRGTADRPLDPGGPIPLPSFPAVVGAKAGVAREEDGHAADDVVNDPLVPS